MLFLEVKASSGKRLQGPLLPNRAGNTAQKDRLAGGKRVSEHNKAFRNQSGGRAIDRRISIGNFQAVRDNANTRNNAANTAPTSTRRNKTGGRA